MCLFARATRGYGPHTDTQPDRLANVVCGEGTGVAVQSTLANIVMELKKCCNHPLLTVPDDAFVSRSERLRVCATSMRGSARVRDG
jgi:hypothetical protein